MRILLKIFFVFVVTSCQTNSSKQNYESKYDIQVLYNYYKTDSTYNREYLDKKYLRDGNLYVIFESDFKKDTLNISINGTKGFSEIVTTEPSTGVAKEFRFENIETINTVSIRINNGKEAVLEIDTMNFFLITFSDTLLKIRVPKNVPFYD
jgi:hypothetical protein